MPPATHTSWFDDDGELTEITDSEDDEPEIPPPPVCPPRPAPAAPIPKPTRPSTQSATQKSRARNGLKASTPCLRPPRTVNYSASALHDWLDQGLVDLDAEYQRGIVWNETKQMNLIDSLFHNFYIPPIVFAVERRRDGSECRICIDGKQRLTSIYRFSKGDIAHKDSATNRKSYFTNPPGSKKRKLITSQMQANFKNKQLTCVEYDDLTAEQQREIFQRVQLGVTLSPADRLPAINGACADLVRSLRTRIDTTTGFETYLEWGKARGKDFQALAQIVYLIAHGHQPRKAEPQTTRLEAFLAQGQDDVDALRDNAFNVMDIFCRIVGDRELGRPLHHNLSPLEMVMSGYLIFLHRKTFSDTQLSDAIEYMRRDIKKSAPEPRFNTQNFKQLLNFVSKEVPKLIPRLKKGPAGEKPAFLVPYTRVAAPARSMKESSAGFDPSTSSSFDITSKPVKTAAKRKRPAPLEKDEEDSDSDFVAPARKAPRKSESKISPGSRLALLKKPATSNNDKRSPARTTIRSKKKLSTGSPRASTSILDSPSTSLAARSKVSTSNTKLETQVAKPSVKPSSSARTTLASSHRTGPPSHSPLSNCVEKLSPLGSGVLASNPSTSIPGRQTPAPVLKPPLPGRWGLPGAFSATVTTSPVEQDFHLPSAANGTGMLEAASLFDSSVQFTRAEDQAAGNRAPQRSNTVPPGPASASTSLSSSGLSPPSSNRIPTTTSMSKLPNNIKFRKNLAPEAHAPLSPSEVNEAKWQADTDVLLNSIVVGSDSRSSQPLPSTSTPLRIPQVSSSSLSPMVSRQVLAPQPPRSNPGGGVLNPGQPVTPMTTPSPTFPHLRSGTTGAGILSPSPTTASGFPLTGNGHPIPIPTGRKGMTLPSNCANGSNTSDPRLARMNAQAQLVAAQQARSKASQTQNYLATPPSPPVSSSFRGCAGTPPSDAPKRPRAAREALQARQTQSTDSDEQQQQVSKRGRSCPGGGRQDS